MIIQGSTPKIKISCKNFNPLEFKKIEVSIRNGNFIITKKGDDLSISNESITFSLSQNESLNLNSKFNLQVQARVITNNDEVKVTTILNTTVGEFIGIREVL